MARNNTTVVPECRPALDQMKYEIAAEFGLAVTPPVPNGSQDTEFAREPGSVSNHAATESYWGNLTSREAGAVGGEITRRLVQLAEQLEQSAANTTHRDKA